MYSCRVNQYYSKKRFNKLKEHLPLSIFLLYTLSLLICGVSFGIQFSFIDVLFPSYTVEDQTRPCQKENKQPSSCMYF